MDWFQIALFLSALLCSLVAGLVLTFAIIVMPGIRAMDDREYLRAFKVMDRIIQEGHPIFAFVWLGSAIVVLATTLLGISRLDGLDQIFLGVAGAIYIFGVHVPTVVINVPINNTLQSKDLGSANASELAELAKTYETRWVRWNAIRTVVSIITTVLFLILLQRV